MSSTASPVPETPDNPAGGTEPDLPFVAGVDPAMQGRLAECDGGAPIVGTNYAGRQEFAGRLTGHYRDYGKYAWRWYLLAELTRKPPGYAYEAVWCDADSLYLDDEK